MARIKPGDRNQIIALRRQGKSVAEIELEIYPKESVLMSSYINRVLDEAAMPRRIRYRSADIVERGADGPDHDLYGAAS